MKLRYSSGAVGNTWEPHPWGAPKKVWKAQIERFEIMSVLNMNWTAVKSQQPFNLPENSIVELDISHFASHDGANYILMDNVWFGWPDPPRWRAAQNVPKIGLTWEECGYFTDIPKAWSGVGE